MGKSEAVNRLDWDSSHFGVAVGNVAQSSADDLEHILAEARADGFQLVYWLAPEGLMLSQKTLDAFGGLRVCGRRLYSRALSTTALDVPSLPQSEVEIVSVKGSAQSDHLRRLALLAGHMSRFRADPRLSTIHFEKMYEQWLERSLEGALATEVLVARSDHHGSCGLLTFKVHDDLAAIGLVSTVVEMQGRGIGGSLLTHAHRQMVTSGAKRVDVVTQIENAAACRLYERSGYRIVRDETYYHFIFSESK